MKNIILIVFSITSLFAQYEIEDRWHLVGYEDNVMYQFQDNYRYSIYSIDGSFGGLDEAGGTPNPYTIVNDIITIDLFFGTIVSYQMNYLCDGQVVEFIDNGNVHSTLFREGYSYVNNECEDSIEDCCEAETIAIDNCGGLGCYIPQCANDCSWEPMQCWSSTGYCWCVDDTGLEIPGTSTPSWQGYPECENFTEECIDGEMDNSNPCNPMECWDGIWFEIVIDCAEWFGVPCDGGIYIPPPEDECCSECVVFGDINIDSNLNIQDIVLMVDIVLVGEYDIIADLNSDGSVNVVDVVQLVSVILNN